MNIMSEQREDANRKNEVKFQDGKDVLNENAE